MRKVGLVLVLLLMAVPAIGAVIPFGDLSTWTIDKNPVDVGQYSVANEILGMEGGNNPMYNTGSLMIWKNIEFQECQIISGWSKFKSDDYLPFDYDMAYVRVGGDIVWQKWIHDFTEPYTGWRETLWENWTWKAPASGTYRLEFFSQGDDELDSYTYHKCISMTDKCNVPEPATIILTGIGLLGIACFRRKIR